MSNKLTISPTIDPKHTLFIAWTRISFVEQMLNNINGLVLPYKDTEIVFYVDTDNKELWQRLYNWAVLNQFVYNGICMIKSGNQAPENYSPIPRRERIIKMKEDSKQYISASEYVFCIEDDTKVPYLAFPTMLRHFKRRNVGFVQGVQMGRWGLNVLGAWKLDYLDDPTTIETMPFKGEWVDIDGGGMFCYLTPVELYKSHKYYYWTAEPGGPDATYGFELRKKGYRCIMDFRLLCDHYTDQGILIPTPHNIMVAKWHKRGSQWVADHG